MLSPLEVEAVGLPLFRCLEVVVEAVGLFRCLEVVVDVVTHDLEPCQKVEVVDLFHYLEVMVDVGAHDLKTCQEVEAVLPADPEHHHDFLSELVVVVAHDLVVDLSLPLVQLLRTLLPPLIVVAVVVLLRDLVLGQVLDRALEAPSCAPTP